MIEVFGNLFEFDGDAICITTNGAVRKDGACVMGRGVALQAAGKWPGIEFTLGERISRDGNKVHRLTFEEGGHTLLPARFEIEDRSKVVPFHIFSLPVKHHWREQADERLIRKSLLQLLEQTPGMRVALPRPGCGNGGLKWKDIRIVVATVLKEDRYVVIERNP
jgi:hypothetical protein